MSKDVLVVGGGIAGIQASLDLADMGMGSGSGSYALASLYPDLRVKGVDVNAEMVERARARYSRPNLGFVRGDDAAGFAQRRHE